MLRNFRKPLIVIGPKMTLRLTAASSPLSDMAPGTQFKPVLDDAMANADNVTKVILIVLHSSEIGSLLSSFLRWCSSRASTATPLRTTSPTTASATSPSSGWSSSAHSRPRCCRMSWRDIPTPTVRLSHVTHLEINQTFAISLTAYIWSQEEHRNQGAWNFCEPRFRNLVGVNLDYRGRPESCQPATGIGNEHKKEAKAILESVFA